MGNPGYIPISTTTPQAFGNSIATDDRSFNKLINVRTPYGSSDANSLGGYASYIQLNGCTPQNPNVTQPYAYSTFQQSSIFLTTFKVRNITSNVYNNGQDGVIDVVVTGGTAGVLNNFDISISEGVPITPVVVGGPPKTNFNVTSSNFTNLGGALVVTYDVTISEDLGAGTICPTVYTITLQTGTTVASTIKLKSSPGVAGKILGTVYNFSAPVVGSGYSSTIALYNANV